MHYWNDDMFYLWTTQSVGEIAGIQVLHHYCLATFLLKKKKKEYI